VGQFERRRCSTWVLSEKKASSQSRPMGAAEQAAEKLLACPKRLCHSEPFAGAKR